MTDEDTIIAAVHHFADLWGSDRCKRSTLEGALERKVSRAGYGITNAYEKVEAMIAKGKLQLLPKGYLTDPAGMKYKPWSKQP